MSGKLTVDKLWNIWINCELSEMRMLRWMMGIKRIETIGNEEIMANISEKIRKAGLRRLGHVERKTEDDAVMRTWKMELGGHRKIKRPELRWIDVMRKKHEEETSKDRRSIRPENVEFENSMRRPQIEKTQKKICGLPVSYTER